jgi:hypothetical protein
MTKCEKLFQKAISSPNNLRIEEVCKLAECYGWVFQRQEGTSHGVYMHPALGNTPGSLMNFQSKNGKAKPYQVRQLLNAIEVLEALKDE